MAEAAAVAAPPRSWAEPGVLLGLLAADRVTKAWALDWLRERVSVPVTAFFHFTYVENTGAAFGVGARRNGFFIVFSTVLLAVLFVLRRRWPKDNPWLQYGSLLVAAGAVGNLYDRIAYGFVVDFLDFLVWPVFNVADSCVTVGAACLAWGLRKDP